MFGSGMPAAGEACPRGHIMRELQLTHLAAQIPNYASGAMCDKCKRPIPPFELIRHCDQCSYDICARCFGPVQPPMPVGQPCPRGHIMRELQLTHLGAQNPNYASGANCDICKRPIPPFELIRHCDQCSYDICSRCFGPVAPMPAPMPGPMPTVADMCPRGHNLREVGLSQLAMGIPAYRSGATCDRCRRAIPPNEIVRHCDSCAYDLCCACWGRDTGMPGGKPVLPPPMCPRGHMMRELQLTHLAAQIPNYASGATCDKCRRAIPPFELVRHCDQCSYDICSHCF